MFWGLSVNFDFTKYMFELQTTESVIALATVLHNNKSLRALNVNRPILFSEQEEATVHFAKMLKVLLNYYQIIIWHEHSNIKVMLETPGV